MATSLSDEELQRRARELAQVSEVDRRSARESLVLPFVVAGFDYALPATAVREVMISPPLARVPGTPDVVGGVISIRGEIVAALRGDVLLGHQTTNPERFVLVLTLEAGVTAGLLVDAVHDVSPARSLREDAPELSADRSHLVEEIMVVEGRALPLLDLESLIQHPSLHAVSGTSDRHH